MTPFRALSLLLFILSGECTQVAINALRPCLSLSHSNSQYIDQQCLSNVFKSVGIYVHIRELLFLPWSSFTQDHGECLCGGSSALVTSLVRVTPLLCLLQDTGTRLGRILGGSWYDGSSSSSAKPMIIDTDMVKIFLFIADS